MDRNNPRNMSIYISVRSGKQVISTSESFDGAKLSRLNIFNCKPTNIWANYISNGAVAFLTVMESLIIEDADSMNIVWENRVNMVWISCINMLLV